MPVVGTVVTVAKPNFRDIERVMVSKSVDGDPYVNVGIYTVPRTIGQVAGEDVLIYTFAYQYTLLAEDVGELTLRFTALDPDRGTAISDYGPITVTETPAFVPRALKTLNIGVLS